MKELDELLQQKKAFDRRQRRITALMIIVSLIALLIIFYSVTTTKKENESLTLKVDSIKKEYKDNIGLNNLDNLDKMAFKKQQETLSRLLKDYIKLRNNYESDSLDTFYADTLYRYFTYFPKKVPKKVVTQFDKRNWTAHGIEQFKIQDTIKVLLDSSGYQGFIKGEECDPSCKEELWEFHFDENNKINFIRAIFSKKVKH